VVRKLVVILLVLSLLLLVGCKEESAQVSEEIPSPVVVEPVEPEQLTVDTAPVEATPEEQEPAPEVPPAPKCGDGVCNGAENCDRCIKDCACKSPAECYQARCKVPECGGDGDCKDNSTCTIDVCEFAQHPNAYCSHEEITDCKNNDECCPKRCDANTDTDCPSVCGNGECEPGETSSNCEDDCEQEPECGNGSCEDGEDAQNCYDDCGR